MRLMSAMASSHTAQPALNTSIFRVLGTEGLLNGPAQTR